MGLDSMIYKIDESDTGTGEELLYWRKFNPIHKWFCDNCEVIEADRHYIVTREDLLSLFKTLQDVLVKRERAEELFPTSSGFFFGSTAYDSDYFKDVEMTISQIFGMLHKNKDEKFVYVASW